MKFWMDLNVKTKAMVLVAVAVLTLAGMAGAALFAMGGMADNEKEMNASVGQIALLNDLKYDLAMIRLDLVYMMTLEDRKLLADKAEDIATRKASIEKGVAAFRKEPIDREEKGLIEEFNQGCLAYLEQGVKLQQMAEQSAGNPEAHRETVLFAVGSVSPLSLKPAKVIADLVAHNVTAATAAHQEDLAGYRRSLIAMVSIAAGAALFMALIGLMIANSISRPLQKVFETLAQVAGGNLAARSDIATRDEMGMLAAEVNLMAQRLMETMQQVSRSSEELASAATQLEGTAEEIAKGAEDVASQVETLSTASEEMSATSGDIAQNCHRAADGSDIAMERARTGSEVVAKTVKVMEEIALRVRESAANVSSLGKRSDQIGEIVGTIEDIADQTNLLALNAAIEAARAGEQGRGFAVVADEVRALAERTTRATREIGEMIRSIQAETRDAVEAMEEGVQQVESGTSEAARSGESLQEILNQIGEVTMQVNQIATAAEEQTATTSEITNNLMQINQVVQQTSHGSHLSATAASQLAGLADGLRNVVGQFRMS
ncbi:methyl-accepting chemotaxis protein [Geomonas sp. Red32]|uniref:methyl-accepting chemotaxis protein n=1 Tax=Geomonas sp. Red32 TaxID=2912856 RepID=UPI00202CE5EF|nr:methyl-accepting chemotaxis protein [Geomonas sp. Red32]MCM0083857.1 methyl-accepting chemotaxis protein [Geomonas sp. Red32]